MLKLRITLATLLCAIAAIMTSCEGDTTPTPGNEPTLELDCYELNVDGNGGDIALFYALHNPIKNEKLQVASNVDWIALKSIERGKIIIKVDESDELETRHGIVTISYKYMERPVRVYIAQDKMLMVDFTFSVSDVTYNSCTVTYMPQDDSTPYMANIIDKQYFTNSGVSTAEEFIAAEMNNYKAIAAANKLSLEQLMSNVSPQLIYKGDAVRKFAGMQHGNSYVAYSYGVTFDGDNYTVTTPIYHTIVELPMPTMYTDVDFNVSSKLTSNYVVDLNITPSGWDGHYYIQIAPDDSLYYVSPGANPESFIIKALANSFFITARGYMQKGSTAEQFLNSYCYMGSKQISLQLDAGKRYMVIVFAVESEEGAIPVMRSMPVFSYPN